MKRNQPLSFILSFEILFILVGIGASIAECGVSDFRLNEGRSAIDISSDGETILWEGPGDLTTQVETRGREIWELPAEWLQTQTAVTNFGSAVVGGEDLQPESEDAEFVPKIWRDNGSAQLLEIPEGTVGGARDVNSNGSAVIGGFAQLHCDGRNDPCGVAYRWTEKYGMQTLPPSDGYEESHAYGVSADGRVVAGRSNNVIWPSNRPGEATLWKDDGTGAMLTVPLGQYQGQDTWVRYLSSDGSVVAGAFGNQVAFATAPVKGEPESFRWTESDGFVPLGLLPGTRSNVPAGISGDGAVIVGNSDTSSDMFVWDTRSGIRSLESVLVEEHGLTPDFFPDGERLIVSSISANGRVMGGLYGIYPNHIGWALFLDRPIVAEPADLNVDGFVDGLDLGVLLGSFNTSTTPDRGELDGTPPVDGLDLGLLLGAWSRPPLSPTATIPEPATAPLLIVAAMSLGALRAG